MGRGCQLCELGIPYSDPIADGPVIQASYTRALRTRSSWIEIFDMARELTPTLAAPVVTMVSYAIVYRHGLQKYVADARTAGIAGAIVPDLPVEESAALARICRAADFSLIQLVTPTTPRDRALRIAETSTGFLYYVSVTGITGRARRVAARYDRQRQLAPRCKRRCRSASASASAGRSTCGGWPRWPTA